MSSNITACGRCGGSIQESWRFCPACGRRVATVVRRFVSVMAAVAVVLFGAGYGLQSYLTPPHKMTTPERHSESTQPDASLDDPQINALRADIEKDPQNLEKLKMLAGMLGDRIRENPAASQGVVFEAIDVLSRILTIAPNDPGGLVMMADVSFDQRAFTKSKDFYERYLKIEPNNLGARARYASTLTFLGEYENAISQLDTVLKTDPKNFPAMAYLAITYAQKGEVAKAKEVGTKALSLAPSEEARTRFSSFMSALDQGGAQGVSPSLGNVAAQPVGFGGVEGFIAKVKANPVAGPKLVAHEDSKNGDLKLVFKDFPMDKMPPFAKEKFFGSLKQAAEAAKLDKIATISFVDVASGATMDQISLAQR
jgi:cytochrome c-type biogenesis protein CcmH/NrfG